MHQAPRARPQRLLERCRRDLVEHVELLWSRRYQKEKHEGQSAHSVRGCRRCGDGRSGPLQQSWTDCVVPRTGYFPDQQRVPTGSVAEMRLAQRLRHRHVAVAMLT